jgi:exopolysaccharide biosynthesis polyprenyl glycosylphosphotransferase
MSDFRRRVLLNLLLVADLVTMATAFALALVVTGHTLESGSVAEFLAVRVKMANFVYAAAFAATWHIVFTAFGLYRSRRLGLITDEWWDIVKAVGLGTLVLAGSATVFSLSAVSGVFVATFFVLAVTGTIVMRTTLRAVLGEVRRKGRNLRRLVIAGCGPRGARLGEEIRRRTELGYLFLGYIDDIDPPTNPLHGCPEHHLGTLESAREVLAENEVDEIIISLPIGSQYRTISHLIEVSEDLGVTVRVPADFFQARLVHAYIDEFGSRPVLTLRSEAPVAGHAFGKRIIDVAVSATSLLVLSPLFLAITAAIVLTSRGPVFFAQQRVGLYRKKFRMLKFRTMVLDAESRQHDLEHLNQVKGAAFKIDDDPRVTAVGRLLRKLSLDELPQLWNVLVGDMSLVGPRPLPMRDVERFEAEWQHRRCSVKPGLTCLWQINGRHEIDFEHWMELDLQYIDNWSLSLDLDILLKTLPAVLRGTGAS